MRRAPGASAAPIVISLAALVCTGCGADLYATVSVSGTVTCNGKPAVGGYVVFEPIDDPSRTGRPPGEPGRISRGMVQEDGTFTLVMDPRGPDQGGEGALVGPHRILFIPPMTEPIPWNPADDWMPPEDKEALKAKLAAMPIFEPLDCGPRGITPAEVEVSEKNDNFAFTLQPGDAGKTPRTRKQPFGSS